MQRHCRVEVDRVLPAGLRGELDRRFGPLEISDRPEGAVVGGLALDQAGLRALLGALWDAGVQVTAVTTAAADQHAAGPRAVGDGAVGRRAGDGAAEPPPRVNARPEGAPPPRRGRHQGQSGRRDA